MFQEQLVCILIMLCMSYVSVWSIAVLTAGVSGTVVLYIDYAMYDLSQHVKHSCTECILFRNGWFVYRLCYVCLKSVCGA